MESDAIRNGATFVQLRCGFDLDANKFWESLGYKCVRVEDGGVRRMRKINVWAKAVSPALFDIQGVEPAVGKTSAAVWAKHKQTGIVTQFVRGQAAKDYRREVLTRASETPPPRKAAV